MCWVAITLGSRPRAEEMHSGLMAEIETGDIAIIAPSVRQLPPPRPQVIVLVGPPSGEVLMHTYMDDWVMIWEG